MSTLNVFAIELLFNITNDILVPKYKHLLPQFILISITFCKDCVLDMIAGHYHFKYCFSNFIREQRRITVLPNFF